LHKNWFNVYSEKYLTIKCFYENNFDIFAEVMYFVW